MWNLQALLALLVRERAYLIICPSELICSCELHILRFQINLVSCLGAQVLADYNQITNRNAEFSMKVGIREHVTSPSEKTLTALGLESNGVRTEFDEPATDNEGIFEMEDDYGTSYYYRGSIENNYIQFAGFYWRIIRINGDGSLRIIYDGTQAHANGANSSNRFINTNTNYNTNSNDNKYVGWMYGPTGTTASTSKVQAPSRTRLRLLSRDHRNLS